MLLCLRLHGGLVSVMLVLRELLPSEPQEWHGFLRDYFCDKDASAVLIGDTVRLDLEWSGGAERHVDPLLEVGLEWWPSPLTISSMWGAHWRDGRIFTALYDTWTLHSWSQWLTSAPTELTRSIVLLHVDDHRDLGSPRLIVGDDALIDAITGATFDLKSPDSVRKSIESGAVGMGSFITPFLYSIPSAEIRHLCQPPKVLETSCYQVDLSTYADPLLHEGSMRPSVELKPTDVRGAGTYFVTSDIALWSADLKGKSVLLHIDMDYFNNRYDGDSDWCERPDRLEPELPVILEKIDELVEALGRCGASFEDIAIAYSPGFFPAEFWRSADERLRRGLQSLL